MDCYKVLPAEIPHGFILLSTKQVRIPWQTNKSLPSSFILLS